MTSALPGGGGGRRFAALDGLRGLFLMVLVIAHLGVYSWAGAWVLLSAFFVASGYLITAILLRARAKTGRIDALGFYRRRAERLLPGLVVLLTVVSVWALVFASDASRRQLRGDLFATLGFVMNWRLINQNDNYFGQFEEASFFRHAWTLAVEEQFYVFAPLLIAVLLMMRSVLLRLVILSLAAVASTWWAASIGVSTLADQARVYYGTDTRVAAILVGVAMAFLLATRWQPPRWILSIVAPIAMVMLMFSVWNVDPMSAFMFEQGGLLALSVMVAVIIMTSVDSRDSAVRRFLAFQPFVWCGVRVYGIYLWHWPIKLWLERSFPQWDSGAVVMVGLIMTLVVAAFSFRFIEEPVITGGIRALIPRVRPVTSLGAALSTVIILAVLVGRVPDTSQVSAADVPPLVGGSPAYVAGAERVTIAVMGDSVPYYLAEDFPQEIYTDVRIVNLGVPGCSPVRMPVKWSDSYTTGVEADCVDSYSTLEDDLKAAKVDALVMMTGSTLALGHANEDGSITDIDDPEFVARIDDSLDDVAEAARDAGVGEIYVSTVPCRSDETDGLDLVGPGVARYLRTQPTLKDRLVDPVEVNRVLTDWAGSTDDVEVLDLYEVLRCKAEFTPRIHGFELYRDYFHFSEQGAAMVWSWLIPQIRSTWDSASR